jgi:hypothetical protein
MNTLHLPILENNISLDGRGNLIGNKATFRAL